MTLKERLAEIDPDILLADGFDEAFLGLVHRCGQPVVALYDRDIAVLILTRKGMSLEEAQEHFEFNAIVAEVAATFIRAVMQSLDNANR